MIQYTLRRLLLALPTLVGVTLLVFSMLRLIPGDPAEVLAGVEAIPEVVERIRKELGLDQPFYIQYARFMTGVLRGDLGRSTRTGRPVAEEVGRRLMATLELTIGALVLASMLGIAAGTISAVRSYSIFDYISMLGALIGVSMPVFWLGVMLMLLFSVRLGWFPAAGRGSFSHLILPVITLSMSSLALIARFTRSAMLEVINQEYVKTARAKGLSERVVVLRHVLRNALVPIVTIIGLRIGVLLSGAVLTETVFAWPGVGRLIVDSVLARDYPVVQGVVLVLAGIVVFVNLAVDILYSVINPRIRYD